MDIKPSERYSLFAEGAQEDYLLSEGEEYEPLYNGIYNKYKEKACMIHTHMPWTGYNDFRIRSWRMREKGIKHLYEISIV